MEVTVPLTVRVEDWMDLDGWEQAIVTAARAAMAGALHALVTATESAAAGRCPRCGSARVGWHDTRPRVVRASFGRVTLAVRRARCRACRHRFRPLAPVLASLGQAGTTAALRMAAVQAGSSWPFATAAWLLRELLGAQISPEQVRRLTLAAGSATAADQQAVAHAVVTPSAEAVRVERAQATQRTRHGSRTVAPPPAPPRLLVGLDGGWVPSHDQRGGIEGKVGVIATGVVALTPDRHALAPRRYVATFEPAALLGELAYAAAAELDGTRSPTQVVIGDGADWIKHQAAAHFPAATGILDWAHLARVVVRGVRAALPGTANREWRRATCRAVLDALWTGQVDAATERLEALRDPDRPCPALDEARGYLASQRDWLGDYSAWQAAGYPVGSGMIERAVAVVINWRLKDRGMRWRRASATAVVALRVEQLNRDWEAEMADLALAA